MVEELRTASNKVGLEINLSKTKVMFNRNVEIQPIMTGNVALDQVDRYIYLGQLISIHRDWEPEVRRRVALDYVLNTGMYQGDIANFDPEDRNGLTDPKRLWPDGIIYYIIDPPLEDARKGIEAAMKEYERVTKNCIRFVNSKGNGHYLKITSMEGCYSTIGMAKGMQILSLRARGCWDSGVYLHELGHTIGLYHEQSRSDRDKYIRIFWDNIAPSNFKKS
ncbi:Zinc metalloproteinase nas-6 [Nymphon striatum]|nr:Zinc metalloproteinase nas-6 [Nymphon striatum]